jgi:hypothetical protein
MPFGTFVETNLRWSPISAHILSLTIRGLDVYKRVLMLPLLFVANACATPQTATSVKQVCSTEHVGSTGSRVEPETECRDAGQNDNAR